MSIVARQIVEISPVWCIYCKMSQDCVERTLHYNSSNQTSIGKSNPIDLDLEGTDPLKIPPLKGVF